MPHLDSLSFLRLTQLADSAVPIGASAHSFGLETLAAEEKLEARHLRAFLEQYLGETGRVEATYCRLAYQLASQPDEPQAITSWLALNQQLSALKPARESRDASAMLGRRFLHLVTTLEPHPLLITAQREARAENTETHYCTCFGLSTGILASDENAAVLAYLQQFLLGLIFVFQRILPVGQHQASTLSWHLKPTLLSIAEESAQLAHHPDEIPFFTPLPDLGSMRHPTLRTRLFIS